MSESGVEFRTGFIGIVGPTNAGKSTLMNGLIGQKISIVSHKTQTTYHGIRGILNRPQSQLIFVDTPGLQNFSENVSRLLNRVAERNAGDCDLLVWVFDVSHRNFLLQLSALLPQIRALANGRDSICVLNKIDTVARPSLLPLLDRLAKENVFSELIPISALKRDGLERLIQALEKRLPIAQALFPTDMVTDRNEQFLVSELIREKIYHSTHQEVPYAAWIEIESWENLPKCPVIQARIHVDAESQQGIMIGKEGERLKRIGMSARKDIEAMLGRKVCLKLHVDVKRDWKRDRQFVNRYLELS